LPSPDRPLNLLFYLPSLSGGGAERLLAVLASTLVRRGHRVTFATDTQAPENTAYLDSAIDHRLLGANHAASTLALRRLLRTLKPDVSLSALSGQNVKHVVAAAGAGRLAHAVQSYHGFYEGEPKLLSRISYLATPLSSRLMAKTVAVSDVLRDELLARFHASPARTMRIYNGCATTSFGAQPKASPPVVLACGRLSPDKNFPFLVRAFAKMRTLASLVILGEGPERPVIEAQIAQLGLGDRVSMPGYRDPLSFYATASCFAMTSIRETFGLVIVEALAAGLPVVTTQSGGPPELLGTLGTIVEQGDETGFAAALDAALDARDDAPLAAQGDADARRERAKVFSMERCADAYETLFRSIARSA
jgi:glycosyltransferase involved in cell wall biosynthesis